MKKRPSKVISDVKNTGVDEHPCRVCGDWWIDLSNKNCWFPKHNDYPSAKGRRGEMEMK